MTDYTVAVLEDALVVLDVLRTHPDGLTLAELTEASGMVKNKVFRLIYTLEKHHWIERSASGHIRLGWKLLEYGEAVQTQTILLEASQPVLDELVEATGESIFLGVVSGDDALCVAARESPRSIRLFAQVGRRAPLHSGGVPKVLFANLPDERRNVLLDHYFGASRGVASDLWVDRQALSQQLDQIRQQNYAVIADELDKGAHSVAAPIRDSRGRVVAALSIAGPSYRFTDEAIVRYTALIRDATARISRALGYELRQPT